MEPGLVIALPKRCLLAEHREASSHCVGLTSSGARESGSDLKAQLPLWRKLARWASSVAIQRNVRIDRLPAILKIHPTPPLTGSEEPDALTSAAFSA